MEKSTDEKIQELKQIKERANKKIEEINGQMLMIPHLNTTDYMKKLAKQGMETTLNLINFIIKGVEL